MTRTRLILIFLVSFLVFVAASVPLRSALRATGADKQLFASGTIWQGSVDGLTIFGSRNHRLTL